MTCAYLTGLFVFHAERSILVADEAIGHCIFSPHKIEMSLTDEEIYNQLKELPDFDRLPLPKYFYEKFNIPPPELLTPMEAARLQIKIANAPGPLVKTEVREPAPGGVRPIIEVEPVKIEVLPDVPIDEALEYKTSEGQDTQVHSDLSGCDQNISGEVRCY